MSLALPQRSLPAGLAQHPVADRDDLTGFLQRRDEVQRRDRLAVVRPAQQHFHRLPARRVAVQADDGLVVQAEFLAAQRLRQCAFQVQPALRLGLQLQAEARVLRLAGLLGAIQGEVRGLQGVDGLAVGHQPGDADAGADHQGAAIHMQRLAQAVEHALRHLFGVHQAGQVVQQHDELVAAEARQVVARSQAAEQALGDFHQHAVADRVAETVIDQLEAVQVDEQQAGLARAGAALAQQRLLQQFVQAQAVTQAGQRIVPRGVAELVLTGLVLADVGLRAGHAPIGDHAARQHPEVIAVALADAVLVAEQRAAAAQVRVDGLAQAGQVVRVHPGEPAGAAFAQVVAAEPEHARPALGDVEAVVAQVPVPDAVVGAAQGAGVAGLAVLQRLALGGAVGVDGQGHVEEHPLEQAGVGPGLRRIAHQVGEHLVQVQTIGAQVPLQLHADLLVHQPDAQAVAHVLGVLRGIPQLAVVFELAALEPRQRCRLGEDRAQRRVVAQVVVELLDETLVAAFQFGGAAVETAAVFLAPLQVTQALIDFHRRQADALEHAIELGSQAHVRLLAGLLFLSGMKKAPAARLVEVDGEQRGALSCRSFRPARQSQLPQRGTRVVGFLHQGPGPRQLLQRATQALPQFAQLAGAKGVAGPLQHADGVGQQREHARRIAQRRVLEPSAQWRLLTVARPFHHRAGQLIGRQQRPNLARQRRVLGRDQQLDRIPMESHEGILNIRKAPMYWVMAI